MPQIFRLTRKTRVHAMGNQFFVVAAAAAIVDVIVIHRIRLFLHEYIHVGYLSLHLLVYRNFRMCINACYSFENVHCFMLPL